MYCFLDRAMRWSLPGACGCSGLRFLMDSSILGVLTSCCACSPEGLQSLYAVVARFFFVGKCIVHECLYSTGRVPGAALCC